MLNRFRPLSKTSPSPVLNGQNQAGWNPKQNQMKNTCLLVHYISSFEGTSSQDTASLSVPLFLVVVVSAFTSANTIFYNFL